MKTYKFEWSYHKEVRCHGIEEIAAKSETEAYGEAIDRLDNYDEIEVLDIANRVEVCKNSMVVLPAD